MFCLKLVGDFETGIQINMYRVNKMVRDIVTILEEEEEFDLLDSEFFDDDEIFLAGVSFYGGPSISSRLDQTLELTGDFKYWPLLCTELGFDLDEDVSNFIHNYKDLPFEYSLKTKIEISNDEYVTDFGNTVSACIEANRCTEALDKQLNHAIKYRLKRLNKPLAQQ